MKWNQTQNTILNDLEDEKYIRTPKNMIQVGIGTNMRSDKAQQVFKPHKKKSHWIVVMGGEDYFN